VFSHVAELAPEQPLVLLHLAGLFKVYQDPIAHDQLEVYRQGYKQRPASGYPAPLLDRARGLPETRSRNAPVVTGTPGREPCGQTAIRCNR
jgi:hypothetical protein